MYLISKNNSHNLYDVNEAFTSKEISECLNIFNKPSGNRGVGGNKLRTYGLFKHAFRTECYLKIFLPKRQICFW